MGTMDTITLDDTVDHNDSSLFFIDETPILPAASVQKETDKENIHGQKRKSNDSIPFPKKQCADLSSLAGAKWLINGSHSRIIGQDSVASSTNSSTTSSFTSIYSSLSNVSHKKKTKRRRKKKIQAETITILSDDEDEEMQELSVIDISDDEVGVIGGEVSKSPQKPPDIPTNNRISHVFERKKNQKKKADDTPRSLRPIVIDGSNVAFGHGRHNVFSSKGIDLCVDYFVSRGHTVKVFVPQFRRRHPSTSDHHILDKLEKSNILVFTPSRKVNGKQVVSYDDRYIVEYATKCGGIIVTRDNFNDLLSENHEWKDTIHNRLLMYTWVDDMLMFPQDPLGRGGPCLNDFLSFPPEEKSSDKTKPAETICIN